MTLDDFLAGILAQPGELDRWLILADWLEDQGDPRAELARLQYALHAEPATERPERLARRQVLLDSALAPVVPTWTSPAGIDFALILPGTYDMGSPASEAGHARNELRHSVTLTRPFYLGVYPVTVGEFARFAQATNYQTEAETSGGAWGYFDEEWQQDASITWRNPGFAQTERHPVVCVSYNDGVALVAWLNETSPQVGLVYALPTEAQWEYACRAGTTTAYHWGDDPKKLSEYAWFTGNADKKTHPVESKRPNPWGLWHLHGLVWEWCADWFGEYPSGAVQDPLGASPGAYRVARGGAWYCGAAGCRAAFRGCYDPSDRYTSHGLRLAVSVQEGQ